MAVTKLKEYKQQNAVNELFSELEDKLKNLDYPKDNIPLIQESVRQLNAHLYDVTSMPDLVNILRKRLSIDTENRLLRRTAKAVKVSHTYLKNFREGAPVSMEIMNRLANHYPVSYVLSNYESDSIKRKGWQTEDNSRDAK